MGRGRLLFKGDDESKAKKKKKKKVKHAVIGDDGRAATEAASGTTRSGGATTAKTAVARPSVEASTQAAAPAPPTIRQGTGHISTSGTVVSGIDTRFERELSVGDALMVQFPTGQEMRVVTMRLSDTSLNLSSAFSQNLVQPVAFEYIAKPKAASRTGKDSSLPTNATNSASGIYESSTAGEVVYREKTEHGSYRIKRMQVQGDVSRTDMLHMRAKKKSDKYC